MNLLRQSFLTSCLTSPPRPPRAPTRCASSTSAAVRASSSRAPHACAARGPRRSRPRSVRGGACGRARTPGVILLSSTRGTSSTCRAGSRTCWWRRRRRGPREAMPLRVGPGTGGRGRRRAAARGAEGLLRRGDDVRGVRTRGAAVVLSDAGVGADRWHSYSRRRGAGAS